MTKTGIIWQEVGLKKGRGNGLGQHMAILEIEQEEYGANGFDITEMVEALVGDVKRASICICDQFCLIDVYEGGSNIVGWAKPVYDTDEHKWYIKLRYVDPATSAIVEPSGVSLTVTLSMIIWSNNTETNEQLAG